MITIRPAAERGKAAHDWLDSRFSFSFDQYHDPAHMGYRALRVINDDVIAPGGGFPMHPHRDMEIITWMLEGALEHRDSLGNGGVILPGDAQYMSAGTGIRHSEFNASKDEPAHLLQVWIQPDSKGKQPLYGQRSMTSQLTPGNLAKVVEFSAATVYAARFSEGDSATHELSAGRHAWIQIGRGEVEVNGVTLSKGDGAAVEGESALRINATNPAEFLLFDLD